MKILLIDDDQPTIQRMSALLKAHHYLVDVATDGRSGLELAAVGNYDLVLLDVGLPGLDGLSICRQLRAQQQKMAILILTIKDSNADVIAGLNAGADDYVTKSCDPAQLLARIRVLLRRGESGTGEVVFTWGDLCLDPATAQVTYRQQPVPLRPKEYNLLALFLRHPQRLFSRSAIVDHLWSFDDSPTEKAVTNLIKDLRRRLAAVGVPEDLIETVYGLGYRLQAEPAPSAAANPKAVAADPEAATGADPEAAVNLLKQLAKQFQASLDPRLSELETAAAALVRGELPLAQQQSFREAVHRLAGSLGTYGYLRGSELARAIEVLMETPDRGPVEAQQCLALLAQLRQAIATPPTSGIEDLALSSALSPILLLDGIEAEFAQSLQQEAPIWGIQVEILPQGPLPTQLPLPPRVILFDWLGSATDSRQSQRLQGLKAKFAAVPILTLAAEDSLVNRVQALRLGIERYLLKPVTPAQIFEAIAQLVALPQPSEARILIVDDDPLMLSTLAVLLQPWGLQTVCLREPEQFWEVLTRTPPDLLLLDLEMPTFNGIDLCRVVRLDAKYGDLPILVVTAHREMSFLREAFDAGADDLIHKPIVGPELVTRVLSRIERSRLRLQLDFLRQQQLHSRWSPLPGELDASEQSRS